MPNIFLERLLGISKDKKFLSDRPWYAVPLATGDGKDFKPDLATQEMVERAIANVNAKDAEKAGKQK